MKNLALIKKYPAYFLLVLIEGGIVMCAEVNTASLASIYYGNSVYLWPVILGVTLAGLTVGYYTGARMSGMHNERFFRASVLLLGVLIGIQPILAHQILPATLAMDSVGTGVLIGCMALLFVPMLMCGIVCPFLIQLLSKDLQPGKASGIVYAVSTIGGIVFTFLSLFVLVPAFGIRQTFFLLGGLFFAASLLFIMVRQKEQK